METNKQQNGSTSNSNANSKEINLDSRKTLPANNGTTQGTADKTKEQDCALDDTQEEENLLDATSMKRYLRHKVDQMLARIKGEKIKLIIDKLVERKLFNHLFMVPQHKKEVFYERNVRKNQRNQEYWSLITDMEIVEEKDVVVFLVAPTVDNIKRAAHIVRRCRTERNRNDEKYHLAFWPERTVYCQNIIDRLELGDCIMMHDFGNDLIPLDVDLFSMEMDDSCRLLYLQDDQRVCQLLAQELHNICILHGEFPNTFFMGAKAMQVEQILHSLKETRPKPVKQHRNAAHKVNEFKMETLIIFDRGLDKITPLLSQLLYQGMLDDYEGIDGCLFEFNKKLYAFTSVKEVGDEFMGDQIFEMIKSLNIKDAKAKMREQLKEIDKFREDFKERRKDIKNMTWVDVHKYKHMMSVYSAQQDLIEVHYELATKLESKMMSIYFYKALRAEQEIMMGTTAQQAIEHSRLFMYLGAPLEKVLQLLCVQSVMDGGLDAQELLVLRQEIVQIYGISKLILLENLQKVGLLTQKEPNFISKYGDLKKTFRIIMTEEDIENEKQIRKKKLEELANKGKSVRAKFSNLLRRRSSSSGKSPEKRSESLADARSQNFPEDGDQQQEQEEGEREGNTQEEEIDEAALLKEPPPDLSVAYTGYAPPSCRLIELALKEKSWKKVDHYLEKNVLKGNYKYKGPEKYQIVNIPEKKRRVCVVAMIGGVTYGEMAAIRMLAQQLNYEIYVVTSQIINCRRIFESLSFQPYDFFYEKPKKAASANQNRGGRSPSPQRR